MVRVTALTKGLLICRLTASVSETAVIPDEFDAIKVTLTVICQEVIFYFIMSSRSRYFYVVMTLLLCCFCT